MNNPRYLLTLTELAKLTKIPYKTLQKNWDKKELIQLSGGKLGIPFDVIRAYLQQKGVDYHFRKLVHLNLRGGVGKTTSSISVATRAVQYGFKTCILDLDPQASASLAFDVIAEDDDPLFYDVWQNPTETLAGSLKQLDDHLYLLPSSLDNSLLDASLQRPMEQKNAVTKVCDALRDQGFDFVVIDCPPTLGSAVISSICAADELVIPLTCDIFSFRGLELSLQEIHAICETFNIPLPNIYALLVKYSKRKKLYQEALTRLEQDYPDYQLPFYIHTSSHIEHSLKLKQTIFATNRTDPAREDYDRYTRHLLNIQI